MGPIQLVVFDMAGTTVDDSGSKVLTCLIEAARAHELPGSPEELNALMGMNKREVFGMLAARRYSAGSTEAEQIADKALSTFVASMRAAYEQHLTPIPGAEDTFAFLSGLSIGRYPAFKSCPSYPLLQGQPVDQRIRDYGIHLLFKQASDGSIIIGDSHEYRSFEDANTGEESTNCLINETVLSYGQRTITLPTWDMQKLWNGYYLIHPIHQVYTETIEDRIHIVTGIAGKGMSTGPGFSRQHIEDVLG